MPSQTSRKLEETLDLAGDAWIDDNWFIKLIKQLDLKFAPLEEQRAILDEMMSTFRQVALDRINTVLTPAIQSVLIMQERGFLVARSSSAGELGNGNVLTLIIDDEAERSTFTPSPFVILTREDNFEDFGVAQTHSYNKETGSFVCEVVAFGGDPGPHNDWVIGAVAGSTVAQMAMLQEAIALRDQTVAAKDDAVSARTDALQAKADAETAASSADGDATAIAIIYGLIEDARDATFEARDEAQDAASEAQDPTGIAGITGLSTGDLLVWDATEWAKKTPAEVLAILAGGIGALAISGTASAAAELRLGEDTDNGAHYAGLRAPADLAENVVWELPDEDGTAGQALVTDGNKKLSFTTISGEIGDFLYSHRNPGGGYLPLDGSVYLKSAYAALVATMDITVEWSAPAKIANPATLPAGDAYFVAWSPNGRYMLVTHSTTPFITIYDWNTGSPVKISNPSGLPSASNSTAKPVWSPNGRYMVVANANTSPYLYFYDWNSGSPVRLSNPATLPTGQIYEMEFSPDGRYLAVAHDASPFITFYDLNSGSPVKVSDPAALPPNDAETVGWSPDGRYLVVGHQASPYITIYDWNTGSPVKISNPSSLPVGTVYDLEWSPDGRYLVVSQSSTPYFSVYDWDTGSPVKLSNPAFIPTSQDIYAGSMTWSPDGRYLVLPQSSAPYINIYDMGSGALVRLPDPLVALPSHPRTCSWTADGRYLATIHISSPYVAVFDWVSGEPVRLTDPTTLAAGAATGGAWSMNFRYFVVAHSTSPFITIYDGWYYLGYNPVTEFKLDFDRYGWVKAA